jgi:hypothetical protein
MSSQQPLPSDAQTTVQHDPDRQLAVDESHAQATQPLEQDAWLPDAEELPRRPRRRLLTPLPLALLGVLLVALGFIAGVLVEKGQGSSSSPSAAGTGGGFASRLRALAGARGSSGSGSGVGASAAGGFTRPTVGTVAYLEGDTLYVTDAEGNTIKVATSAGTSVTKNVKSSVGAIHPGETVTVSGTSGASGVVTAEAITVGGSGAGGLASLFGGPGSGRRGTSSTGGAGEPQLFGR